MKVKGLQSRRQTLAAADFNSQLLSCEHSSFNQEARKLHLGVSPLVTFAAAEHPGSGGHPCQRGLQKFDFVGKREAAKPQTCHRAVVPAHRR